MSPAILRGRPEERFKLSIGVLVGTVIALPVNVLNIASWQLSTGLAYGLVTVAVIGVAFRKRAFVVGTAGSILLISLPPTIAAIVPGELTNWHVSAGVLWLIALSLLGCLYLMREAETRTDADIDVFWLFRTRD